MTDDLPTPVVRPLKPDATDADGPLFSADQMRAYRAANRSEPVHAGVEEVMSRAGVWSRAVTAYVSAPASERSLALSDACAASYRALHEAVAALARKEK